MRRPTRSARERARGSLGVNLARALSKLGILSRSQAIHAILAGRVRVDGRIVRDPALRVVPERVRLEVDDEPRSPSGWRTILFHKPRGIVTTRSDPEGRETIYDLLGDAARGLVAVGRLDLATSGVLLLTSDTALAAWLTDPANAIRRVYAVTVRGRVDDAQTVALEEETADRPLRHGRDAASPIAGVKTRATVVVRKASGRETHLLVELREGRNRQIRRMFDGLGHQVTRLKRVSFGGLELGELEPGEWRELTPEQVRAAFPRAPITSRGA